MDPTVGTFAGSIVEPIDVLTMDIRTLMAGITADIILTPMEGIVLIISGLIVGMCAECTVVHIDGVITDAIVSNGRPGHACALCDAVGF
jgi:hypothetical protein